MMGLIFYGQLFSRCMHVNVRDILMSDMISLRNIGSLKD